MMSFDFFDTLFTRKVARPAAIFSLVSDRLLSSENLNLKHDFKFDFKDIRISAESIARRGSGHEDITFDEIYNVLKSHYHLSEDVVQKIKDIELDVERSSLVPIKKNIDKMLKYIKSGEVVCVLSDMYLPSRFLKEVLIAYHPSLDSVNVFVSGEKRRTKASGGLYRAALDELVIKRKRLVHIGDNLMSDYVVPRRLGHRAEWACEALLQETEVALVDEVDSLFLDLVVGKWREIRLLGGNVKEYFGFKYVTSAFFGFVYETLMKLSRNGSKRVYFLARDGQVLKYIADLIIQNLHLDIRTEYIYVSRRALFLASLFELNDEFWGGVFLETPGVTFNTVLSRLQIGTEEFVQLGGAIPKDVNQELSRSELKEIERALRAWSDLRLAILEKAANSRKWACKYFDDLGFLDEETINIVDVGWAGSIQDGIFKIYRERKNNFKIEGWYWAVIRNTKYSNLRNIKHSYLFYGARMRPIKNIEVFIELLAQADHGQAVGYGPTGVVLTKPNSELIARWKLPDVHKGLKEGVLFILTLIDERDGFFDFKKLAMGMIEEFRSPTKMFAEILGGIPYSAEQDDSNLKEVAPYISFRQFIRGYFSSIQGFESVSRWMEGSVIRSFKGIIAAFLIGMLRVRGSLGEAKHLMIYHIKMEIKLRCRKVKLFGFK